jgi:hypothetical protein
MVEKARCRWLCGGALQTGHFGQRRQRSDLGHQAQQQRPGIG